MRHRLAVAGVGVLGLMVLLALLAPWIRRYSPIELDLAAMSQAPSAARWLGTDTTVRHVSQRRGHRHGGRDLRRGQRDPAGSSAVLPRPGRACAHAKLAQHAARRPDPTILEGMPWLWLAPGLMIALAVLSINFIGDGLRDALDPRPTL